MNRETFDSCMRYLGFAFPASKVTEAESVAVYWDACQTISDDLFTAAIRDGVKTWKFFPRVSEIVEVVEAIQISPVEDSVPPADAAWEEMDRAWGRYGSYGSDVIPKWSHPIIGDVVKMLGGLHGLVRIENLNKAVIRGQFMNYYAQLRNRYVDSHKIRAVGRKETVELLWGGTDEIGRLPDGVRSLKETARALPSGASFSDEDDDGDEN